MSSSSSTGSQPEAGGEDLLDEVLAKYLADVDAGRAPPREELLRRHPQLRDEIEEYLSDSERFDKAASMAQEAASPLGSRKLLGGYEILEEAARGGMGVVYKARQPGLNRVVALKAIIAGRLASPAEIERFQREARAIALLDHPNILPVHEVSEDDGIHFFTMKFMEGGSLARPGVRLDLTPRGAAALLEKVARAVHFAHQRGILHRDLKPANILLDAAGEPQVSDFGLAKPVGGDASLTVAGQIVGTASYMAPEQALGRKGAATVAADVYSLGAILYELLAGRPPFQGESTIEILRKAVDDEPPRLRSIDGRVPDDLEAICLKCLEKAADARYASAAAMADDLARFLSNDPVEARRIGSLARGRRWCRRHPARALAGALIILIALGASAGSVWLHAERGQALRNLAEARLSQAEAVSINPRAGRRIKALEAVRDAARIAPSLELRNAAAAALACSDLEVARRWEGCPPGTTSVVFDAGLRRYARGSAKGEIVVSDVESGRELTTLPARAERARVHRFSPDGRYLAARYGDWVGLLGVWDWKAAAVAFDAPNVWDLAMDFHPAGTQAALVDSSGVLQVLELPGGRAVARIATGRRAQRLAFSPRGDRIALGSGNLIELWDPAAGTRLTELQCPGNGNVFGLAWHPDGRRLAASCGTEVTLWDAGRKDPITTFHHGDFDGIFLAFHPKGDLLATWGFDGRLWLRGLGGEPIVSVDGVKLSLQFSRDGGTLGAFRSGSSLGLWRVAESGVFGALHTRGRTGEALDIDPSGELLATTGPDGVHLWDLHGTRLLAAISCGPVVGAAFAGTDALLILGKRGLHLWPLKRPGSEGAAFQVGPPARVAESVHLGEAGFSATVDGKEIAALGADGSAELVDLDGPGRVLTRLRHHNVIWVAVSPHAEWIATGPHHGDDVKVWNARSGEEVWRMPAPVWVISGRVLFSPDGKWLGISTDSQYHLVEVGTWKVIRVFPRRDVAEAPGPMAFDRDSRLLAIGVSFHAVQVLDLATFEELVTLEPPEEGSLHGLSFSADGWLVATARPEGTYAWDLPQLRRELAAFGLDWSGPRPAPARESTESKPSAAPRVEVDLGELGGGG